MINKGAKLMGLLENIFNIFSNKNKDYHNKLHLEIHFHQQEEGSVFLESNIVKNKEEEYAHILLLTNYIWRNLSNLELEPSGMLNSELAQLSSGGKELLKEINRNSNKPKLVDYKGTKGRKRFTANLDYKSAEYIGNFQLHTKGFGLLGHGISYYAPVSVILLIKYLSKRYIEKNEEIFLEKMCDCFKLCSQEYFNDNINLQNEGRFTTQIADIIKTTYEK